MTEELSVQSIKNGLLQLDESLRSLFGVLSGTIESLVPEIQNGNDIAEKSKKSLLELAVKLTQIEKERFDELRAQIIATAETIEEEYTSLVTRTEQQIRTDVSRDYLAISDFGTYTSETATAINQQADSIALSASQLETIESELADYIQENNASISLLPDSITNKVEENFISKSEAGALEQNLKSIVTQTATGIREDFSASYDISGLTGELTDLKVSIDAYIRRGELETGIYGIEIGQSDSNIVARFTNDKLSFRQGNAEVAYISDSNLYITRAEVLDSLRIGTSMEGYFTFDVTMNGLELRWSE